MFTGIIQELGTVKEVSSTGMTVLTLFTELEIGESIAVNGVCLTATNIYPAAGEVTAGSYVDVALAPQTLSKTNLGALKTGDRVNLERALKANERLGGHIVTGHIDTVAVIKSIEKQDKMLLITINTDEEIMQYIAPQGSDALDGISLTVAGIRANDSFSVSVIPHTARITTLGFKEQGDTVNLEVDILCRYVLNAYKHKNTESIITKDFLLRKGFV